MIVFDRFCKDQKLHPKLVKTASKKLKKAKLYPSKWPTNPCDYQLAIYHIFDLYFNKSNTQIQKPKFNYCKNKLIEFYQDVFIKNPNYKAILHNCAMAKQCNYGGCKLMNKKLRVCKKCKSVYYCSRICQKRDWLNGHSKICKSSQYRKWINYEIIANEKADNHLNDIQGAV